MAKRQAPGKADDNPGAERRQDRHNAPQPPDAVGGPDDTKTPVAESGDLPGPQGRRPPMQPGGQPNLPS
jgi:hypothetical protein